MAVPLYLRVLINTEIIIIEIRGLETKKNHL